jgi:pyruvate,water dikinase
MARDLPLRSPRCNALLGLAGPVQVRIAAAALVPLAVILGPMVMVFVWLPQRVDPAVMSARPGSDVDITALVQSDYREPLTLSLSGPLAFKTGYGSTQKLQPIRETMLEMYKELGSASDIKPLAARVLAERSRESLKASMEGALPPQPCTWKIVCVDNAVGEFPVSLRVGNGLWLFNVVFGDRQPPSPTLIAGDSHLVLSIQLKYNAVSQDSPKAYFWHPFKPKSDWDPGWLLTYLVVYVPVMFGVKWGLRVA